uniref:Uncharacterized protein n=1 Tax=Glossina morsitans morsitans TaxID=37546 RepID=A0A1B0F9E4_GLOMM
MSMSSVQSSIKKRQQNKTEQKRYRLDLRFKQKVFIILLICTDNYTGLKQEIAPILRKALMIDRNYLFEEYGLIEATVNTERLVSLKKIQKLATEDAIKNKRFIKNTFHLCLTQNMRAVLAVTLQCEEWVCLRKWIKTNNYIIENMEHIYTPLVHLIVNNFFFLLNYCLFVCYIQKYVVWPSEEHEGYEKFIAKLHQISGIEFAGYQ